MRKILETDADFTVSSRSETKARVFSANTKGEEERAALAPHVRLDKRPGIGWGWSGEEVETNLSILLLHDSINEPSWGLPVPSDPDKVCLKCLDYSKARALLQISVNY